MFHKRYRCQSSYISDNLTLNKAGVCMRLKFDVAYEDDSLPGGIYRQAVTSHTTYNYGKRQIIPIKQRS